VLGHRQGPGTASVELFETSLASWALAARNEGMREEMKHSKAVCAGFLHGYVDLSVPVALRVRFSALLTGSGPVAQGHGGEATVKAGGER
jgi:hypothetical protein